MSHISICTEDPQALQDRMPMLAKWRGGQECPVASAPRQARTIGGEAPFAQDSVKPAAGLGQGSSPTTYGVSSPSSVSATRWTWHLDYEAPRQEGVIRPGREAQAPDTTSPASKTWPGLIHAGHCCS